MRAKERVDAHVAGDSTSLLALARQQLSAGKLVEAEATCRQAVATAAPGAEVHQLLGKVMQAQERGAEAIDSFAEAARLDPANPKPLTQLAAVLGEEGRLVEAAQAARDALTINPVDVDAWWMLGRLKRFSPGDPELSALEAVVLGGQLQGQESIVGFFTLAKAYEDAGDYQRAFDSLRRANVLQRATFEYDVEADVRFLERIAAVFDDHLFERFRDSGTPSDVPILIIGMPRSGTTLVEQILASHPDVHGGGELRHLPDMVSAISLLNSDGLAFPDGVARLGKEDLARFGHGYSERLRKLGRGAARVVDKNSWNFKHVGFARLIVPHAHVIHCVRDPVDTCVSCYSLFGRQRFDCDLEELGRYYGAYSRLMAHWRDVLPGRTGCSRSATRRLSSSSSTRPGESSPTVALSGTQPVSRFTPTSGRSEQPALPRCVSRSTAARSPGGAATSPTSVRLSPRSRARSQAPARPLSETASHSRVRRAQATPALEARSSRLIRGARLRPAG